MLKIEGGTVFIAQGTMIKDAQIYDSIIVFETPKDTKWDPAKVQEYLDQHTTGEVIISECKIMDRTGYANMMKKKADFESKLERMLEKIKGDVEQTITTQQQPAYKRFLNKVFNKG